MKVLSKMGMAKRLPVTLALAALAAMGAAAQEPRAAQRPGEKPVPFDGGFGHMVYPLSDARLCPNGATHFYSYSREFSVENDMVFTCKIHPQNANIARIMVYDKEFRLVFDDAASAARLGAQANDLETPQFSHQRRVMFARLGTRIMELDPWNRKSKVFADFSGLEFSLPDGRKLRAGTARDFKIGPGDAIIIELGVQRRALNPGAPCPACFELLGVATFDPVTKKTHTYTTRGDDKVAAWPKVKTMGFDESNLTQDSPARVFLTYENRPSWSIALDFSDAVEFRQPSFGPYGDRKYQWSAHGHMGFFCGSNGQCYVVKALNDIIDNDLDGVPDRVGQVGTKKGEAWRPLQQLTNTKTGKVELIWGADRTENGFSTAHFSRSFMKDVFFGSGARHEGNTITRYTLRYDAAGKPTAILGENLAHTNSDVKCGYWAHPRVTSSDDGMRGLFDSTLAGGCKPQVYVVVANTTPGQTSAPAGKR